MEQEKVKQERVYTFYPGCSLEATGMGYKKSMDAVAEELEIQLIELEDWNCCGATAYMSVRELPSLAIASRNLAMAEPAGRDIVTPCSACYLVLNKTNRYLQESPEMKDKINAILAEAGLEYHGTLNVRHLFEVIITDIGLEEIRQSVRQELNGMKVASYYGCQLVRPYGLYENKEMPQKMEELVEILGGEALEYPMKVKCCGASLIASAPDIALVLIRDLLKCAKDIGAECIITPCPLCQFNLDVYQDKVAKKFNEHYSIPILYFTQLLGLALGVSPSRLGFEHSIVPVEPLLARYGLTAPVRSS
ncbi:CoB--CoM heterodisulfide reductase iron-sulfur subunit B family protein [Candidatus Sumerlaeota bacterium]|nr:CoB--CoM heterodisulfide reductase iron-sulfur subunit B family protein [Candidatus Sumerlaeota bacterium]